MTEVKIQNFNEHFPQIKKYLEEAKFVAIDLEFSALYPLKEHSPSLFDTPNERYEKLRRNLQLVAPLQLGLTAFSFDPEKNTYLGRTYNFYLIPACFPYIQKNFMFQSDTLGFLKFYGFDFNKFAYSGIPFINRDQEEELRARLKNNDVSELQSLFGNEIGDILLSEGEQIKKWYAKAKNGDTITVPKIFDKYEYNYQVLYFLHKNFRRLFKDVWTFIENKEFVLKKVLPTDYQELEKLNNLEEELVQNLLGFSKVFRLLTALQKPLTGHNLMQDILLLIENFETSLPISYKKFKLLTTELFPKIFDTKTISYELKSLVPEDKRWNDRSLETIFEYFKDGIGRHLALNSPAIELENADNYGKYHEAGWDSFCTGYIFVRMAYLNIFQKFPKSKNFMSSELIAGLSPFQNRVNVIRGAVSSIKIDGDDPESTRPPYLVVESLKKGPLNVHKVSSMLSSFGFVEIRKFPYHSKRALIAVDNFGNNEDFLNMVMIYGECNRIISRTCQLFAERYPEKRRPNRKMVKNLVDNLLLHGSFKPKVKKTKPKVDDEELETTV